MESVVKASTEGLWRLYTVIGDARDHAAGECIHIKKSLDALEMRLCEEQYRTEQKIDEHEQRIKQLLKEKEIDHRGEINALRQAIEQLQIHLSDIRRCKERLLEYAEKLAGQMKCNQTAFQVGQKKVNQYLTFLEIMTAAEEMVQFAPVQNRSSGQYYAMDFRGVKFYCNDSEINIHLTDENGQTNLQRMKRGQPPIGKDGQSVNLHHMQQSDKMGGIMELSNSTHQKNHGVLHVNTHDIPSGINRTDFEALKKAYWKKRAEMFSV